MIQGYAQTLKQAAHINIAQAQEHKPNRAHLLRAEIRKTGKRWNEFTVQELIEINRRVDSSNE